MSNCRRAPTPARTRPVSPPPGAHEAELPRQGQCSIKPPPDSGNELPLSNVQRPANQRLHPDLCLVIRPPRGIGDLGVSLIAEVPWSPTFSKTHTGPALIKHATQLTTAKADTAVQPAGHAGTHVVFFAAVRDSDSHRQGPSTSSSQPPLHVPGLAWWGARHTQLVDL